MCKNTNNNPIRTATLSHLTNTLETITKTRATSTRETRVENSDHFLSNLHFAFQIGAITRADALAFVDEISRCSIPMPNGEHPSCEPCRCEDCSAFVPISMTEDIGGEITVCKACYEQQTDPRARDNASVEAGWDGCGDFEDTPAFMRGHPTELD
jgi:hypothetical protein